MAGEDGICVSSDRDYLMEVHKIKRNVPLKSVSTFMAPNRSFPRIPLNKSSMITIEHISQAGPDYLHHGKILLCRSIMPVAQSTAFMIELLIDEPGSQLCLIVDLFNFPGTIRPGTIFAIMHPYFKRIVDQMCTIRVENPQHVHIFNGNDPLIRGLEWTVPLPKESGQTEEKPMDDHQNGNLFFEENCYLQAIEAYSQAIQTHGQPKKAILYSNRALTYLKMERPDMALRDTQMGLKLHPSNVKLLFRNAKALIQLKRYEEAASFLEKASKEHKETMKDTAFAHLVTVSKRMVEESKGNYDILEMREESKLSPFLENHADYYAMGKFQVENIPGKGRGLVAKEKIRAGTLLMACKAFIFADKSERAIMVIEPSTKSVEVPTFASLVQKACQKLLNNPELGDNFNKLHAGRKWGCLEMTDHSNPVDIDRISGLFASIHSLPLITSIRKKPRHPNMALVYG